ncbi:amino acid permease [Myxococcota bacterium]|nr:amino acid permease [Myxococcota bacterium]MBU1412034.1 amino acid permease [Myxococcota bacterium]MBU1512274.1 amino acid permease [Myxococcota bacterium]
MTVNSPEQPLHQGHGFGAMPVFLTAISTILGAILFLRFGWAIGHQGVWGALLIVLVGHVITIPTALAVSEIATNRKVEGGGAYYIISRSFGTNIGAAIGVSLFLSQAISVAFYLIAFAQSFTPVFSLIKEQLGFTPDPRMISLPVSLALAVLVFKKGASLGVMLLYVVVAILFVSLLAFFMGGNWNMANLAHSSHSVTGNHSWTFVFAVCFPAFTGIIAGVGLSGDLKNPRQSIPLGTMTATVVGLVVYTLVVLKLGMNGTSEQLANDELFMTQIAAWGPLIPIGLAAATLSSAIGSLLIAPRTMQALAGDQLFPWKKLNHLFSMGIGPANEPLNGTILTMVIAIVFIMLGDVNVVAAIVSQFFLVTYGAICLISVMEHFAANPSYRPSFRSRWWISLTGAIGCIIMMIASGVLTTLLAVFFMVAIYISMRRTHHHEQGIAVLFKGAIQQVVRRLQIWLQKNRSPIRGADWRPSFIAVSGNTFERLAAFDLLRWLAHRQGFGTYFHFIKGMLTEENNRVAAQELEKIIQLTGDSRAGVYADTIISPSFTTSVAQIIQVPGVAGMDNNGLILEFARDQGGDEAVMSDIHNGVALAQKCNFNICVLRSTDYRCGYHSRIHIWLTEHQLGNANLMILLAYIMMGHPEWSKGEISVFAAMPEATQESRGHFLVKMIQKGRLPISPQNVSVLPYTNWASFETVVSQTSREADLVMLGFTRRQFQKYGTATFNHFAPLRDTLFVCSEDQDILLVDEPDAEDPLAPRAEPSVAPSQPK